MTEVRAVLLDALGTLVELEPPAPRLRRALRESGFEVTEERAMAGFAAEIAYYLDHHLDGSDPERLERLRDRCAEPSGTRIPLKVSSWTKRTRTRSSQASSASSRRPDRSAYGRR